MTNPHHNYLTEPRWFTARAMAREVTGLDMWAQLAAIAAVLIVIAVIAG